MEPQGWSPLRRRSKDRKGKDKERDVLVVPAHVGALPSLPSGGGDYSDHHHQHRQQAPHEEEGQQQQQQQHEKGSPSSPPFSWSEAKERRRSQRADAHADIIGPAPGAAAAVTAEVNLAPAIAIGMERLRIGNHSLTTDDGMIGTSYREGASEENGASPETKPHDPARPRIRDKGKEKEREEKEGGSSGSMPRVPAISMAFLRRDNHHAASGSDNSAAASLAEAVHQPRHTRQQAPAVSLSSSLSAAASSSPSQKLMRRSVGQRGLTTPASAEPRLIHQKLQRDRQLPRGSSSASAPFMSVVSSDVEAGPELNRVLLTEDEILMQRQREEKEEIYGTRALPSTPRALQFILRLNVCWT
jgi:hypothetical protein